MLKHNKKLKTALKGLKVFIAGATSFPYPVHLSSVAEPEPRRSHIVGSRLISVIYFIHRDNYEVCVKKSLTKFE
jgi:hypothetical protein